MLIKSHGVLGDECNCYVVFVGRVGLNTETFV